MKKFLNWISRFFSANYTAKNGQKFLVDEVCFGDFLKEVVKKTLRNDNTAVIAITEPFLLSTDRARIILKNFAYNRGYRVIDVQIASPEIHDGIEYFEYSVRINLKYVEKSVLYQLFPFHHFPQLGVGGWSDRDR